jgi:hypothetical protein
MAFTSNNTQQKSKNQFSARMVTKVNGNMVNWVHPTDDFARKVCGVKSVTDIPFAVAAEKLPYFLDSDKVICIVTEITDDFEAIAIEEY